MKTFHKIHMLGAYFLSRFFIGIGLFYPATLRPVDLLGVLRKTKGNIYEMQVIMGGEKHRFVVGWYV